MRSHKNQWIISFRCFDLWYEWQHTLRINDDDGQHMTMLSNECERINYNSKWAHYLAFSNEKVTWSNNFYEFWLEFPKNWHVSDANSLSKRWNSSQMVGQWWIEPNQNKTEERKKTSILIFRCFVFKYTFAWFSLLVLCFEKSVDGVELTQFP